MRRYSTLGSYRVKKQSPESSALISIYVIRRSATFHFILQKLGQPRLFPVFKFRYLVFKNISCALPAETNEQRLARAPEPPDFSGRQRPPNTLVDHSWEQENLRPLELVPSAELFPCPDLPHARALDCTLRGVPKIILTEKFAFSGDPESFCYAFLLLDGCWRSDTEVRGTGESWLAALQYHGLARRELPDIPIYQYRLIDYMLESARHSRPFNFTLATRGETLPFEYLRVSDTNGSVWRSHGCDLFMAERR